MNEDLQLKEQLSIKLRLIGEIRPQQKINTTTMSIVNNNVSTSFWRTIYTTFGVKGHSQEDLYNWIKSVTEESYQFIKKHNKSINTVDKHICDNLKLDIEKAKINITAGIRETYIADQAFVIRLEQLAESISLKLKLLEASDVDKSEILRNVEIPIKSSIQCRQWSSVPDYPLGSTPSPPETVRIVDSDNKISSETS